MPLKRQMVGQPENYQGRTITVRLMGPDLLGYVDDIELSGFFWTAEAARVAARKYIDDEQRASKGKAA